MQTASTPAWITFRDAYTGQEDQHPDFGTGYTDFGARQYSPALRRWMAPDPLSEKYYGISPYAFCADNPVNIIDADGEVIGFVMDVISVGCGVYNLAKNLQSGDTKAAWGDVAGIGLDLVCAVIPGVTINAGTAKTLAKSSLEIADKVVDAKGAWSLNPFDRGKSIEKTLQGWGEIIRSLIFIMKALRLQQALKVWISMRRVISRVMPFLTESRVILMIW